jgi:hypothetical protein
VSVIKDAALKHGKKTFRGSVVVNLSLDQLAAVQAKLGVDLGAMSKIERGAFMKQHRLTVVGLLEGEGEMWSKLK